MKYANQSVSRTKGEKLKKSVDKENQPFNAGGQVVNSSVQLASRKIGLQIRNRVQRSFNQAEPKIPLKESLLINEPVPRHKRIESCMSSASSTMKSVSFDDLEKGAYSSLERQGKFQESKSIVGKWACMIEFRQKTQANLANSHVSIQDQSVNNNVGNKVITDKYEGLMKDLKAKKRKYKDQIYPPLQSSIYLSNSLMKNFFEMLEKEGRSIEWMRLSELYKQWEMVIWTADQTKKSSITKGFISKSGGDGDFLANVFNVLKDKTNLLEKMFESQVVNGECVYYVKIYQTQTNIWKYMVIDDYIPVIVNKRLGTSERYLPENVHPAFLGVSGKENIIEIWPFLLQKAYAKYYSTYDTLANGNSYDFLQEITGAFIESIKVAQNLQKINDLLKNDNTLFLIQDKKGVSHPLQRLEEVGGKQNYAYLDRDSNYSQKILPVQEFLKKMSVVHYACLDKYHSTSRCQIQQQNVKNKVKKSKQAFILRQFTIAEACECQIATVQKQQRFYRNCLSYEYSWMRVIVVQKESSSYRWIDAAYSNGKAAKIVANLSAGEYVVIMMPEWRDKPYDFNLIFRGSCSTLFQRKDYDLYSNIVQQSCMDIAQRLGKMVQVNKNICSYHFIERNIGFIIENVNNEKEGGSVKILRSIDGLQNYGIRAFNDEFKGKLSAEIVIARRSHFTVVLMTSRGVQKSFLDMFDFGF